MIKKDKKERLRDEEEDKISLEIFDLLFGGAHEGCVRLWLGY
jgi:hypothetical protein